MDTTLGANTANWRSAHEVWAKFCEDNPGLGLGGSFWSFVSFNRQYGAALRRSGIMAQSINRRHLADASRFNDAVFHLLTGVQPKPRDEANEVAGIFF